MAYTSFKVGDKVCLKPGIRTCSLLTRIDYATIISFRASGAAYFKAPNGNTCWEPVSKLQLYKDPNEREADMAFKVGDIVKCVGNSCARGSGTDYESGGAGWERDKVFTVGSISDCNGHSLLWPKDGGSGVYADFVVVTDSVSETNKENEMSDVQDDPNKALRELDLDADTRLLRDMGFENSNGSPQENARTEMFRRIWQDMRAAVATDLRKAIANEATDKQEV